MKLDAEFSQTNTLFQPFRGSHLPNALDTFTLLRKVDGGLTSHAEIIDPLDAKPVPARGVVELKSKVPEVGALPAASLDRPISTSSEQPRGFPRSETGAVNTGFVIHEYCSNDRLQQPSELMSAKPIGLYTATSLVIANMVGTGVFTNLGFQVLGIPCPKIHNAPMRH